jgi:glycosyltransferase involved in cell wall biosynthesis
MANKGYKSNINNYVLHGYRWNYILTSDMGEGIMTPLEQQVYSRFPESLFSTVGDAVEYNKRLLSGLEAASQSNVVITGLGRNIIDILDHTMARLYKTASFFKDCKFVILENDSDDGTSEKLRKYADKDKNIFLIQEDTGHKHFGATKELERPLYLGGLRNKSQEFIVGLSDFYHIDYVIVIDLDLEGGWSYDGIMNSLSYGEWSAITANGLYFREKRVTCHGDVAVEIERLFQDSWAYRDYGDESLKPGEAINLYRFERGEKPKEVFSNFNGLGVYRFEDMRKCKFSAEENEDGTVTNEWAYYHREMRKGGCHVYLNPSMITLYSPHEFSCKI